MQLVTLSTGQQGLRGCLHIEARDPVGPVPSPGENPCLDFISSDASLDRYSEIISPAGWKLDTYLRNPVFQNAHQYGDIIFTLGKALITEVRSGPSTINSQPSTCLFQRIQFAVEANPIAKIAHALYAGGFLHAVSVGFIPLRWEDGTDTNSPRPSDGRGAGGEGCRRRYLEQELLEVSAVAIPANPNALALAYKSGAVEKSDLQNTIDILRQTMSPISPIRPVSPIQLALLRDLRDLLKS